MSVLETAPIPKVQGEKSALPPVEACPLEHGNTSGDAQSSWPKHLGQLHSPTKHEFVNSPWKINLLLIRKFAYSRLILWGPISNVQLK